MKITKLITIITTAALSVSFLSPVFATDTAAKREIYNANKGSVFGVTGVLKMSATIQGQLKNQEAQIWSNATCVGDGILVAAYSSISPKVGGGNPLLEVTKEVTNLQLVSASGEKFNAKIVLHDEDIDLVFIAIDPQAKNMSKWKNQVIDCSKETELQHLDDVLSISRYADHFGYQSAVTVGTVSAILNKPRKLYQVMGSSMSAPLFSNTGDFIGITATKVTTKGQPSPPVTIPAKYINKLLKPAIALQDKLKK